MLFDKHQQQVILEHCWNIYDLITNTFHVDEDFHVEYISNIESVLLTNRLYFKATIEQDEYRLIIQEDYDFHFYELSVVNYSYILTDSTGHAVIWSDPAPHHQTDYRGQNLANFPHHLHDSKGRICNFSGRIEDFLKQIAKLIR